MNKIEKPESGIVPLSNLVPVKKSFLTSWLLHPNDDSQSEKRVSQFNFISLAVKLFIVVIENGMDRVSNQLIYSIMVFTRSVSL